MAIDFKIGEFREAVILQRQVSEQSETGAVIKRWVDCVKVYGKLELLSTGEAVSDGGRITNISTYKLTVYFNEKIDSSYRAIWRGKVYEIMAVEPLRYVFMEITMQG